jgi:DNA-binding beta-propeller fold protein YncE
MKRTAIWLSLVAGLSLCGPALSGDDHRHGHERPDLPRYVVDPWWPKPLPNRWVTGAVGGICIDHNDHVFGINRSDITALELRVGKVAAPPVIEYTPDGDVVQAWGDPSVLPIAIHGCFIDHQRNLWIAGSGGGMIQKWTRDGRLLLQIGSRTACDGPCGETASLNSSTTVLNQPADIAVDPVNGDVYVADGYGNHRVVVFDAKGQYLRQWGSKGTGPGQFAFVGGGHPHCVVMSREGLLYVCDRGNDRIQVFTKQGQLVEIIPVKPGTGNVPHPDGTPGRMAVGSSLDVDFSADRRQRYLLNVDTGNEVLWILDRATRRGEAPEILGGFGSQGHNAGNFTLLHMIAVDSKGNLYTSETVDGRRLQKFVPKGALSTRKLDTYMGSPHYEPFPDPTP